MGDLSSNYYYLKVFVENWGLIFAPPYDSCFKWTIGRKKNAVLQFLDASSEIF